MLPELAGDFQVGFRVGFLIGHEALGFCFQLGFELLHHLLQSLWFPNISPLVKGANELVLSNFKGVRSCVSDGHSADLLLF